MKNMSGSRRLRSFLSLMLLEGRRLLRFILSLLALKGRNTLTMGAAYREYRSAAYREHPRAAQTDPLGAAPPDVSCTAYRESLPALNGHSLLSHIPSLLALKGRNTSAVGAAHRRSMIGIACLLLLTTCTPPAPPLLPLEKDDTIVLVGNNLCAQMMDYPDLETAIYSHHPQDNIRIRNLCDAGNTPGFRPHPGIPAPWAFPGAEKYQNELAQASGSEGHFETPDEWLGRLQADVILAFFGANEAFSGSAGLPMFEQELAAFIQHTLAQNYNGKAAPRLIILGPTAYQKQADRSLDLPDGQALNENLALYSRAMQASCEAAGVPFVDLYTPSQRAFNSQTVYTSDGFQLNQQGHAWLAGYLSQQLFGASLGSSRWQAEIRRSVADKNWHWHMDYKIPNGVHVYGRRYAPFGSDNYPEELIKIREMTTNRDTAIWMVAQGKTYDLATADARTTRLSAVETNYDSGAVRYLYGEEALASFTLAPGYALSLFASEESFPDLANPCQLSFDDAGRLWVAVMPSYPHWRPGDPKPNDKLLILEDTDGDGQADKQTIFADSLHLPVGFEFAPEGVFVGQGTHLMLLRDTDGDDQADQRQIIFSGFDDHDTHHVISAFCADPSGAIYMGEGVFLHTNVETAYGPVRGTNGGFYRFNPQRRHLERTAQIPIPNPWGTAFDDFGQAFFLETSGPALRWMLPSTILPRYGVGSPLSPELVEEAHRVRPTSGLEFVSSRHFPAEVQGDILLNNTIGFLGTKQHRMQEAGTGYTSTHRQDLLRSSDPNFRPVDLEFAPDGSLYIVDWHNVLVGHMQHNARDPLRDHVHGRVYRLTYPARPLLEAPNLLEASVAELLDMLQLPEYRTRYRVRRMLRAKPAEEVLPAIDRWIAQLDAQAAGHEHYLLEALWVSWGLNQIHQGLLRQLLEAQDHRVRAAAVQALRHNGHQVQDQAALLEKAAQDAHSRVRLSAIVAASWLAQEAGNKVLAAATQQPMDDWMLEPYAFALAHLNGQQLKKDRSEALSTSLKGADKTAFLEGHSIYQREGYCITCHQADGKGLQNAGFPPLAGGSDWVIGDPERLIKIALHGLAGPMQVQGQTYSGQVPMTGFGGLLNNQEIAAVLTYIRNSFGNEASPIQAATVAKVRAENKDKKGFWTAEDLLEN